MPNDHTALLLLPRVQRVLEKLVESRRWLYLHGVLTDAENKRVAARIEAHEAQVRKRRKA